MLNVDLTLLIQIANFLVLLFLLNLFLYRPIRGILARRQEEQDSLKGTIELCQTRSNQNEKLIEDGRIQARKEGKAEKDGLKGLGREKEQGILQEASAIADEKIGNARKDIESQVIDVRRLLDDQIALFSKELAEKILGRNIQ